MASAACALHDFDALSTAVFAAFACEETHLPNAFDFEAFVPYVVANDVPIDVFAAAHIAFAVWAGDGGASANAATGAASATRENKSMNFRI